MLEGSVSRLAWFPDLLLTCHSGVAATTLKVCCCSMHNELCVNMMAWHPHACMCMPPFFVQEPLLKVCVYSVLRVFSVLHLIHCVENGGACCSCTGLFAGWVCRAHALASCVCLANQPPMLVVCTGQAQTI
jgi:hypothetical protein